MPSVQGLLAVCSRLKLAHTAQRNMLRQMFVRHIPLDCDILILNYFRQPKLWTTAIMTAITKREVLSKEKIDPRLQSTIEGIFNQCKAEPEGEYKQVTNFYDSEHSVF